jgi:hypothetical protein
MNSESPEDEVKTRLLALARIRASVDALRRSHSEGSHPEHEWNAHLSRMRGHVRTLAERMWDEVPASHHRNGRQRRAHAD